jgi:ankyrin repeat protein
MLSRINKAVKHHYEQLDLSRVSKLLNHVAKNNVTDVKLMLSQGLNPDACAHHDKRTALMIAASEGHLVSRFTFLSFRR